MGEEEWEQFGIQVPCAFYLLMVDILPEVDDENEEETDETEAEEDAPLLFLFDTLGSLVIQLDELCDDGYDLDNMKIFLEELVGDEFKVISVKQTAITKALREYLKVKE